MPTRTATVSERITQRFKEFRLGASTGAQEKSEVHFDADVEEKGTPKLDKGKGRALDVASPPRIASPPPMSPPLPPARMSGTPPTRINTNPSPPQPAPPIMVAGLTYTPAELSALFKRAKSELPLRAVRFPLIGEYQDVFSGEDFATWLKEKVEDFGGNLDRAAFAARELTEKHNLLRRLGELGNDYVNASDVFYQIRPKVRLPMATLVLDLAYHIRRRTTWTIWTHKLPRRNSQFHPSRRACLRWPKMLQRAHPPSLLWSRRRSTRTTLSLLISGHAARPRQQTGSTAFRSAS